MNKADLVASLIELDQFTVQYPILIDMPYKNGDHEDNFFDIDIYKKNAPFLLHKDLAQVVLNFSKMLFDETGWITVLRDGLRTIEAQKLMCDAPICRANPQWFKPPVLISSPGGGGHPRGAAVDVTFENKEGHEIDLGTKFDYFSTDPNCNPAARDYSNLSSVVLKAREITETLFLKAAEQLNLPLLPLPSEWWDYRFQGDYIKDWPALSDQDLPDAWRLCAI